MPQPWHHSKTNSIRHFCAQVRHFRTPYTALYGTFLHRYGTFALSIGDTPGCYHGSCRYQLAAKVVVSFGECAHATTLAPV